MKTMTSSFSVQTCYMLFRVVVPSEQLSSLLVTVVIMPAIGRAAKWAQWQHMLRCAESQIPGPRATQGLPGIQSRFLHSRVNRISLSPTCCYPMVISMVPDSQVTILRVYRSCGQAISQLSTQ